MAVVVSGGSPVSVGRSWSPRPSIASSALSLYGSSQTYAALYRMQPNVRLVISFLGRNVAQLGLKAFRRVSDDERLSLPNGHPLGAWLRTPNSISPIPVTRYRWIRALVEDLALYDTSLHVKLANPITGRLSAVRIPPTNFVPIGDNWLWPEGFRVFGNNGYREYTPEQVIYFVGHNPADPLAGCPPIEALRRTLAEDVAAGEYRESMWRNGARMSGTLERPVDAPKWSKDASDRFVEDFQATWTGPMAGGVPLLEEGMKFNPLSFSAKDAEYLGARRLSREEAAAQFFIPPVFVGILENANFSNVKEQHRSLYSDTLGPWLEWIDSDLEVQVLPSFDDVDDVYLEFNIEAKLAGSFEEQAAAMQSATGAPWMTRDEARARRNMPPLPDGQGAQIVTPLNVLVGGQASPNDSAPPLALPSATLSRKPGAKALPVAFRGWEAKALEVVSGFFERQKSSVVSRLGAGHELEAAFDVDRWNEELRVDLFALALGQAEDVGGAMAEHAGAEFDVALAEGWLEANARAAAEGINASTLGALGEVYSGVSRGQASRSAKAALTTALAEAGIVDEDADEDLPDDPFGESFLDPARDLFAAAIAVRAVEIATSRAGAVGNFARHEGASQAGLRTKTWVGSGSPNSRHADLDGETVPIGETFSNGGQWPGDPALGVDQTAGCLCSLDFS